METRSQGRICLCRTTPVSTDIVLILVSTDVRSEKSRTSEEEEDLAQQADYVTVPEAGCYKEQGGDGEEDPSPNIVSLVFLWAVPGHGYLLVPSMCFADR